MIIATVLTALFTVLMILGVRAVARYMLVTFAIVWLGMLVWLVAMLVGSHAHFIAQLERPLRHDLRDVLGRPARPRLQRGRPDRLGRHPLRDDLLLPGVHRLPVDRVLRR